MMQNVKWLISAQFENMCLQSGNSFIDAVKGSGLLAAVEMPPDDWTDDCCVIVYGSKAFNLRFINRRWIPGSYYRLDNLSYSGFSPYLAKYMLNDDYYILPFAELKRRKIKVPTFIRPDKTTKIFTGMTLYPDDFDFNIITLEKLSSVSDNTLCVIATNKPISKEYRFVIADREIVASTEYSWTEKISKNSIIDARCVELVQTVAKEKWQPDRVYVCDICISEDRAKILELNPFSSSGLYNCDLGKVVRGVSNAAWKEYIAEDLD